MEPDLVYLILICLVLVGLILFFLASIVVILIVDAYREKKYNELQLTWEKLLLDYLEGEITAGEIASFESFKNNAYLMWRFLFPYLESLKGEDYEKIVELSRFTGMQSYYLRKLRRGSVFNRALAARILGKLQCREALLHILPLLQSRHPAVVITAAHSIADLGQTDYMIKVTLALLRNTSITFEGITEILVKYGEKNIHKVISYLEAEMSGDSAADALTSEEKTENEKMIIMTLMVDILGYHRSVEAMDTLQKLLMPREVNEDNIIRNNLVRDSSSNAADDEIIIHIFKAFLRIDAVPPDLDLSIYFNYPNWVVRSLVARVSIIAADEKYISLSEILLDDSYWWVRYRAAESLWNMGKNGRSVLMQKAKGGESSSATVSRYILAQEV